MQTNNNDIEILKLYEDSGVNESYNDNPHNFFDDTKPIFIQEQNTSKQSDINISILNAKTSAENLVKDISNLKDLQTKISSFTLSPLSKFASHIIVGCGVENPKLLVITEMPNSDEDKTGIPLNGPTGELLKKILKAINSSTDTNTYTFPASFLRTPGTRNPTAEEMEIVIPFIKKFIDILQPKIILTMGSLPTNILLNSSDNITNVRGKWFKYKDINLMPTFSLSYLFNNTEAKKKTWSDLQLLAEKL